MRKLLLKIHLYAGLVAAAFLIVLGVTGSILAFENYYDQWLHPTLWSVAPQSRRLSEQQLVDTVQRRFAPVLVATVGLGGGGAAQVFTLTDNVVVFVNPLYRRHHRFPRPRDTGQKDT